MHLGCCIASRVIPFKLAGRMTCSTYGNASSSLQLYAVLPQRDTQKPHNPNWSRWSIYQQAIAMSIRRQLFQELSSVQLKLYVCQYLHNLLLLAKDSQQYLPPAPSIPLHSTAQK